ncbi:hypothetical protein GCM10025734_83700 [Kitasatospora paranensis]|uniref:baeRF2 domain-containing protein n=1 Tax=Kitasatospora paranensis TaxID=258053 RepID=UPI0031E4EA84
MDLDLFRPLYTASDLVVSVHLDTSREDQDADHRVATGWRALRRDLEQQGADEPTLLVLDGAVGGSPHLVGPQGESLFAADGRMLGAFTLARPPARDRAVVGPVADPLETAFDLDHQLPYVMVALDREGADVDAFPAGALDPATSRTFSGSTLHITRVRAGGANMASYHRRTVNVWTRNAAGVATEIAEACEAVGAALVFVGGDPKATAILREELAGWRGHAEVVEVPGGRGERTPSPSCARRSTRHSERRPSAATPPRRPSSRAPGPRAWRCTACRPSARPWPKGGWPRCC